MENHRNGLRLQSEIAQYTIVYRTKSYWRINMLLLVKSQERQPFRKLHFKYITWILPQFRTGAPLVSILLELQELLHTFLYFLHLQTKYMATEFVSAFRAI